ncbi:MAG: hypothetical protein WCK65_01780 [Rhodospirillaceae bacterium]
MALYVGAASPLTRVFVDNSVPSARIIRAVVRQIGFALVSEPICADVCMVNVPVADKLSCCPGTNFSVQGLAATFDVQRISSLEHYQRRSGRVDALGRSFAVSADHCEKSETLHLCASTLFRLLLSNGVDARFLWWFPNAARGVVNYRVDVDDNSANSFDCVEQWLHRYMSWCSLYFTTSCFTNALDGINRSRDAGAEIGSHCHYHYTFERDPATNAKNLLTSIEFLRRHGCDVSGAVMPSGKSFHGIARVMAESDILYTSNFGLIFDSLPIELSDGTTTHLEVPCHPVAPGNVIKASADLIGIDDYLIAYYMATASHLCDAFLPIFIYGHNNDTVNIGILPRLLDELIASFPDHEFVRLDEYAAFWRDRLNSLADPHQTGLVCNMATIHHQSPDVVSIKGRTKDKTWPLSIEKLFRSPLSFAGVGARKPRLRDRLADRYELETVLPISALSLATHQGWKSAVYKLAYLVVRALFRR